MASAAEKRKKEWVEQFDAARRVHDQHRKSWHDFDLAYHGVKEFPKNINDVLRSKLRIPWIWQQIETIKPRIMDPDPLFEFHPVEERDIDYSQALNTLIRQQLTADRFSIRQSSWVEDGLVRGVGIAKVIWLSEYRNITRRPAPTLLQKAFGVRPDPVTKAELVFNRPTVVYVDPYDFMWDPAATNDDNWAYVFHRSWLSKADLKQREKLGLYKGVDKATSDRENDLEDRSVQESSEEAKGKRDGKYPVWERWSKDGTVMVMCGDHVLRDDPNPYWHGDIPFAVFRSQPTPRSLVGVSEVEKVQHIQEAIWTRDNQRIDAVSLALNAVMIVDPTIPNAGNMVFQPGAKFYATPGQRIEQLKIDPMQIPGFEETQSYLGSMQQMTGASPYLAGSDPSMSGVNQNTATGASILQEEGNKRMMVKKLEFRLFEARIAKMMVQLDHQYLSGLELEQIVGKAAPDIPQLQPHEIPMFLDVLPKGMDEAMSQSAKRQEDIELLNVLGGLNGAQLPNPDGSFSTFTIRPHVEKTLEDFGRDPQTSFIDMPQPPMPEQGMGNVVSMENVAGGMQGGATV